MLNSQGKWKLRYHQNVHSLLWTNTFQVLTPALTERAHTLRQRDVRDFLINLGKRGRHLP